MGTKPSGLPRIELLCDDLLRENHVRSSVVSVCSGSVHAFSKASQAQIRLIAGLGVEGDAHLGMTVKHRSRVAVDPAQPNLRQVHLLHEELFAEVALKGFRVRAGELGENVTTRGIDLLSLPAGTVLRLGEDSAIEVTGLRNPCVQIDQFQSGLLAALLDRDQDGALIRKAGIMAIVRESGVVRAGDAIQVVLPTEPHRRLERV